MGIILASSRAHNSPCIPCPEGYVPGNPGTFEELHKKVKDLYPPIFEGAKLRVKRCHNEGFFTVHSLTLSSMTPSGYKLGTCYTGSKHVGRLERYPMIMGELMPNGNLATTFVHTLGCRLRVKHVNQIVKQKFEASSSTIDYRSDEATFSITLDNPDFSKCTGTLVVHYLQALSNRLTAGTEFAFHRSQLIPGGQESMIALALRYSTGLQTFSATIGNAGLHFCYHHKASQQLQLGVELETSLASHDSSAGIFYQLDVPDADIVFRGMVNTKLTVGGVLEKKLYPIPDSSLILSVMLNHGTQHFQVGIGLNVG
ncbi:mitochondrial import receptor subunit TOM40 homolog 2 [Fopius arisanus]|uniref:Mitochondrial import receptor subunit TOM40 homolog 2 n=2 Tax=Fopius arisanus TaxID=64838 RepID=A0A9R1T075_9HYME|nr:PREDICTED: mitochondrial import receptor subunit TOM40 homolog 2-like [Fopius arisanus]